MDQQASNASPAIQRSRTHGRTHHHITTDAGGFFSVFAHRDTLGPGRHHVAMNCSSGDLSASMPDLNVAQAREMAAALLAAADDVEQMQSEPATPTPAFTGAHAFSGAAQ